MTHIKPQFQIQKWSGWIFAGIILLNIVVYGFSVFDIVRSDHVYYFAEMADKVSWWDHAIATYDLNRHRIYSSGDEILFRPFLYFVLGNEKYFFNFNFPLWQMFGVGLHLWVVWLLWKLLRTIKDDVWAPLLTALFSVIYANVEMVLWSHINGYMIFVGCLLFALRVMIQKGARHQNGMPDGTPDMVPGTNFWLVVAVLVGCFTYEVMNVYALGLIAMVWLTDMERKDKVFITISFVLIVVSYIASSLLNIWLTRPLMTETSQMALSFNLIATAKDMIKAISWWFGSGLLSTHLSLMSHSRVIVAGHELTLGKWFDLSSVVSISMMFLICGFVLSVAKSIKHKTMRTECWQCATFILGMIAVFALIIISGRSNTRGFNFTLATGLYYGYIFWVMLIVVIQLILAQRPEGVKGFWGRCGFKLCVGAMCVLIGANAFRTFELISDKYSQTRQYRTLIKNINPFVEQHKNEKDFSFYVPIKTEGNFLAYWVKHKDRPEHQYSFVEALWPQYFDEDSPKYVYQNGQFVRR